MSSKHIDYYLTPVSPWTYLGAERFRKIAEKVGCEVRVHLVDYGAIFPKTGGLPLPKRAPERLAYRMADLKRFRDFLNIPLIPEPQFFPSKTRASTYAIMATIEKHGDHAGLIASEAILAGLWSEDLDMDDHAQIISQLNKMELDGATLLEHGLEKAEDYDAKISSDTEKALADNVFGAPSYVIDGEVFWGQDRLDLLAWRLGV